MKSLAALAALCLLGAVAYSLLAPAESLPGFETVAALADAASEPQTGDSELAPLEYAELAAATLEALAPVEELDAASDITLTGRVTPRSGMQPAVMVIAQSQCAAEEVDCSVETYEAEADAITGEFAITVGPGTWRLVARSEGFLPATEDGLKLSAGEEVGDIIMLLEKGERITGTVVHDGEPVEGANVSAISDGWTRTAMTDPLGHYEIVGLPPGTYSVLAYSGLLGGDEKKAAAGSTVHLTLGHREKIRGLVVDARGMPVEGAAIFTDFEPVAHTDEDPLPKTGGVIFGLGAHGCGPAPACYQRVVTGPDGRFEVEVAVGETLAIGARHGDRFASVSELAPGSETVLELKEPLRIRVVDAEKNPVAGAELEIEPYARFVGAPAPSGADGWVLVPDTGFENVIPPEDLFVEGEVPVKPWQVQEPMPPPPPPELVIE